MINAMNDKETEGGADARIIDESRVIPASFYNRVGLSFFVIALVTVVVAAIVFYLYIPYGRDVSFTNYIASELPLLIDNEAPVEFVLVPSSVVDLAIEQLVVPSTSTDQYIWEEYAYDRSLILSETAVDTVYDFPVKDTHFGEFINATPLSPTIYQILDEVRELVYQTNAQTGQNNLVLPLGERVGRPNEMHFVESVSFGTPPITTTAPSLRVVEAEVVTLLLGYLFPDNEIYYQQLGDDYINKGLIYGLYGPEDIVISKGIARLYWETYKKSESYISLKQANY